MNRLSRWSTLLILLPMLLLFGCKYGEDESDDTPDIPLPIDKTFVLDGLQEEVDVLFDDYGVPYIYARNDHDALFLQGYLSAKDRFGQMELARKLGTGRIGELIGQLPIVGPVLSWLVIDNVDIYYRTIFTHSSGRHMADVLLDSLDPDVELVLQSYADGVNAFLQDVLDHRNEVTAPPVFAGLLQVDPELFEPWTVRDTLVVLVVNFWSASNSIEYEIAMGEALTGLGPGRFYDFYRPAPDDRTSVLPPNKSASTQSSKAYAALESSYDYLSDALPAIQGALDASKAAGTNMLQQGMHSNNWVVDGDHSLTGHSLIANDPHLGLLNPAYFWLVQVDATTFGNGTFHYAGLGFPAAPGVQIGHNEHIGWAGTAANYDTYDAYIETLNEDGTAVIFNGEEVPIVTVPSTFRSSMEKDATTLELPILLVPHHGPILPGSCKKGKCISVKWTGLEVGKEIDAFLGILTSQDVDQGLDNFNQYRRGPYNWVVADKNGRVGYTAAVDMPIRHNTVVYPPWMPLPGTGEAEWFGHVPDSELARYADPESGFIVSANNDIYGILADNDALDQEHYFYWLVDIGYRAARISQLLSGFDLQFDPDNLTLSDMMAIQADNRSTIGLKMVPYLLEAGQAHPERLDQTMQTALDVLASWDFTTPSAAPDRYRPQLPDDQTLTNSAASTIFHVWFGHLAKATFGDDFDGADLELPGDGSESGPQMEARALLHLLSKEHETFFGEAWWDDLETAGYETRDITMLNALSSAVDYLTENIGPDPAEWAWGKIHTAEFGLTFEGFTIPSLLSPVIGPAGSDGGIFTVNVANTYGLDDDYYNSHAPAARMVMEIDGDRFPAKAILPGGQSERFDSAHFDDMFADYLSGSALPVYFKLDQIVAAAAERILYTPVVK